MPRKKERGDRKPHAIYCTVENAEICRMIVALPDEKIQYIKGWIERGANTGGKK